MELLILLVLILLNGFFAMSEMAVVSSRRTRLQQWADDKRPGAASALALANQPSFFLSTIQVGITLIGITSGAFGEAALAGDLAEWLQKWGWLQPYAEGLSVSLVVAGITVASLIIGELVPKRVALRNPEGIASAVARPMQLLSLLAHPVVRALSWLTETALSLLRLGGTPPAPVTEEEIKVLMEQGARAGVFEEHEQMLVSRVFRFDHVKVGAIMTPRTDVVYLDLEEPRDVTVRKITEHAHSRFPVVRGGLDRIEGVVLARNLLGDALAGKPLELARHLMKPLFVPTGISAMELVEQFRKQRQTLAIAVNEHGAADGVVTVNDVMEALVGDIAIVEEEEDRDIKRREDGSWLVDGSVTIERLKAELDIEEALPGEEAGAYHTVGGFVMEELGRVPAVGDSFEWLDWRWEVVDMDYRRVDKVLATRTQLRGSPPANAADESA
jgi:putative hemolysin